ncbi:hypothetical protein PAXRUDRAFT_167449 [Paxillus rubicundulus Ve08.2h10]|uniref:Uncharacterized protein n=1 Tax=Paxillus rubicundulus Ve08.2h10 TaxID=930991 RepID=A0A0D0D9T1_9AGAM|nr:hypothetical protein PAXRUDRAFT_167449 [Paxillus rubicundulus Ve08.2h10]
MVSIPGSNRNNWCEVDSPANTEIILSTSVVKIHAANRVGANSARMHIHEGISTQRNNGDKDSQKGLHSEEINDGWK